MGEGDRRGDPSYQATTRVDGIRFPDAFGPILGALIVAGAVNAGHPQIAARARLVAPFAGRFNALRDRHRTPPLVRHQARARRSFSCPSVAAATVVPDIVADLGAACHRGRAIVCSRKEP
jgi:hypothetical protein